MNPVAEEMTGWPSTEAAGRKVGEIFAIVDETTEELTVDPVAECLSKGRLHYLDGDTVLLGRYGERRDVRASAAPVRTPQGTVIGAVLVFQDVADSRALQRQLAHTAMHDSLTGLPNRATFQHALDDAVRQAQREAREHALCFIDLDHFKTVNDNAGHAAGDAVLRDIGDGHPRRLPGARLRRPHRRRRIRPAAAGLLGRQRHPRRPEDHRCDRQPARLLAARRPDQRRRSAPASASPPSPAAPPIRPN